MMSLNFYLTMSSKFVLLISRRFRRGGKNSNRQPQYSHVIWLPILHMAGAPLSPLDNLCCYFHANGSIGTVQKF